MRESAAERHDRLLALVRERGTARVADLAVQLGVSPVTARRDVEALAGRGLLDRVHGQVSWPGPAGQPGGAELPAGSEALSAAPGRGPVIGLLAPSATYYFAEVIRGAREAAARAGARLILRISDYRPEDDRARTEGLLASGAEGLLVAPGWRAPGDQAEHGDWIAELPVPAVLLERRAEPGSALDGLDRVSSDHRHGVLLAVRHLVGLGHGAPLLVARADSPTALAVRAGYARALRLLGLDAPGPVVDSVPAELQPEGFEAAVRALRAAVVSGAATAALVHNDVDAIQMVQRLAEVGVRVPEDLALIAYDDEVAALADIPLTAVAPPKRQVGRLATELLVERLAARAAGAPGMPGGAVAGGEGEGRAADARRQVTLLPSLRVRASCGAAPMASGAAVREAAVAREGAADRESAGGPSA